MSGLVGKVINNRFHFAEYIGRGGMAEVYKVWDAQRIIHIAAKVLHKDMALDKIFLRRFKREADTLTKLQHPHIIRSYGLEQEGRLAFLLMDFVEGESLKELIFDADKPLPEEQVRNILRPVAGALHYAHSMGFVHCDIKPANIMLDKYGEIRLADFGIARVTDAATATMIGAGTPAYMAPEQIKGQDPIPQTDIYALGIVLFEMLTGGERPFVGELAEITGSTSEKVRWEQMRLQPPSMKKWNPNISPELDALVQKCLQKDPKDRYQNPLDLLNAFERAISVVDAPVVQNMPVQVPVSPPPVQQQAPPLPVQQVAKAQEPIRGVPKSTPPVRTPEKSKKIPVWAFVLGWIVLLGIFLGGVFGGKKTTLPVELPTRTLVAATKTSLPTQTTIPTKKNISTETPASTKTSTPPSTLEQLSIPTIAILPQQWNGTITYRSWNGSVQRITFLIEDMDETAFTGRMIWQGFDKYKGAVLRANGEFITDFGDEFEQMRWNNHEDYKKGDRSGYWLKWTETEIIEGGGYTVNGWYYAHIREDGTMIPIYFFNDHETTADVSTYIFYQK